MATGQPFPDIPRLLAKARAGGAYTPGGAERSLLERYAVLWRALEAVAKARGGEGPREAICRALLSNPRRAALFAGFGSVSSLIQRASDQRLGDLSSSTEQGGPGRLRGISRGLAADPTLRRDSTVRQGASLLAALRNGVVHTGVMTSDAYWLPLYGFACGVLDVVVEHLYVDLVGARGT